MSHMGEISYGFDWASEMDELTPENIARQSLVHYI